jgi:hypothetical protein
MKQISMNRPAAIAIGTVLLWQDAFAYIAPGTGSLMIQWLFGMVLAGFALLNIYWLRIKSFFAGKSGHTSSNHDVCAAVDEPESD